MANDKKVTFIFEGGPKGWTESFVKGNSDAHEVVMESAKDLATARALLLGANCRIKAIRVGTEGADNDAMLEYLTEAKYRGNPQKPAAQPDVALMIRCENAAHTRRKMIFLRGIWDEVENDHGQYVGRANADWKFKIDSYLNWLKANGWGWMRSVKAQLGLVKSVARGDEDTAIVTLRAPTFNQGQVDNSEVIHVRISKVNGKSTLNGAHVAVVTALDKFETISPVAFGRYRSGGYVSTYTYEQTDIHTAVDTKIVTRECGAPLLESRGRAKARPRA